MGANKRERLYFEDPYCFWCGVETVLGYTRRRRLATVDHVYSRLHPKRKHDHSSVLACWKCNADRAHADQTGRVFIPPLECRRELALEASAGRAVPPKQTRPPKVKKTRLADMGKYPNAPSTVAALMIAERGKCVREPYVFN